MRDLMSYIPKKYKNAIADFYRDDDGYWIRLDTKSGYKLDGYYSESTVHEDTLREALTALRENIVKA